MKKTFTSFEEIDKELKRLWLQSEIDKEELRHSLYETKESITPGKLITSVVGGLATGTVIMKLLTPVLSFGIGKFLNKYRD